MAGRVFFGVTMSLDGFIAPEASMDDPDVQRMTAQWMELQQLLLRSTVRRGHRRTPGATFPPIHRLSDEFVRGGRSLPS